MKRKLLLSIAFMLLVFTVACSSEETNKLTLEDYIGAYTAEGIEVDPDEKPMFQAIGAVNGVLFYPENSKVAIYEYESAKKVSEAKKQHAYMKDWKENGNFVIETSNQQAIDIFMNVK